MRVWSPTTACSRQRKISRVGATRCSPTPSPQRACSSRPNLPGKCFRLSGVRCDFAPAARNGRKIAMMESMKQTMRRPIVLPGFASAILGAALLATAGLVLARPAPERASRSPHLADPNRVTALPPVMLWAWERPEDLSSIDPAQAGVAFLARTVFHTGDSVSVRPRLQPLSVPPRTALLAVVRIQSSRRAAASLSLNQREQAAHAIAFAADLPGLSGLQIDFDATASERVFYRGLLAEVRRKIPARLPLS